MSPCRPDWPPPLRRVPARDVEDMDVAPWGLWSTRRSHAALNNPAAAQRGQSGGQPARSTTTNHKPQHPRQRLVLPPAAAPERASRTRTVDGDRQPTRAYTLRRCVAMLMQFDPFREIDRLAEQLAAGA